MSVDIEPIEGLAIDPRTGHPIQNTGCGDRDFEIIRTTGTIANARTRISATAGIKVGGVSSIGIYCKFTVGSLTSADLEIEFSDEANAVEYKQAHRGTTVLVNGVSLQFNMGKTLYNFDVTNNLVLCVSNPCAQRMNIYLSSTGTVTGSEMQIHILRGWGNGALSSIMAS